MKAGHEPQPLGSRAFVIAGQSPEGKYYNNSGQGLPFYQGKKDFGERELQPPTVWTSQTTKEAQAGDILMSVRAPVGPINFAREAVCIGRGLAAIRCRDGLDPDFLFYQLLGMQADIAGREGAVFASINKAEIEALTIVVPPLPEQRGIVAILDEAFEGIATAKANAEKNLQNARELFAGHLQATFSQRDHRWVCKTVQEWVEDGILAKPQDGNHGEIHPTKADYVDFGVPFIMAADMIDGGVDTEGCRFIAEAQASTLRIGFAKSGDVLLSHKGTIGRVAILDTSNDYVILTPQVTYYRSLDSNRLFNGFLYYCLLSPDFQATMNRIAGAGSTRAYIGITRQLELQIALPPIDLQRETAARLRHIDEASNRLAGVYEAKIAALGELKNALLHQAFTGAL